jgi:hypothetical protein
MNKNSLHWMTKQHQTTLRFKAYLVGKLTMWYGGKIGM